MPETRADNECVWFSGMVHNSVNILKKKGYYSGGLSALLDIFYFFFGEIGKMLDENPFIF